MAGFERLTDLAIPIAGLEPRVDGTPLRGLGWLEVAAVMGKLPPDGCDLLRALYLHDRHALARTLKRLWLSLHRYSVMSDDMRRALAVAALQAFVVMRPCVGCDGAGHIQMEFENGEVKREVCGLCEGDGFDHLAPEAVCDMVGVGPQVWSALIAEPFGELYRELRDMHEHAKNLLERRVK